MPTNAVSLEERQQRREQQRAAAEARQAAAEARAVYRRNNNNGKDHVNARRSLDLLSDAASRMEPNRIPEDDNNNNNDNGGNNNGNDNPNNANANRNNGNNANANRNANANHNSNNANANRNNANANRNNANRNGGNNGADDDDGDDDDDNHENNDGNIRGNDNGTLFLKRNSVEQIGRPGVANRASSGHDLASWMAPTVPGDERYRPTQMPIIWVPSHNNPNFPPPGEMEIESFPNTLCPYSNKKTFRDTAREAYLLFDWVSDKEPCSYVLGSGVLNGKGQLTGYAAGFKIGFVGLLVWREAFGIKHRIHKSKHNCLQDYENTAVYTDHILPLVTMLAAKFPAQLPVHEVLEKNLYNFVRGLRAKTKGYGCWSNKYMTKLKSELGEHQLDVKMCQGLQWELLLAADILIPNLYAKTHSKKFRVMKDENTVDIFEFLMEYRLWK